MYEDQDAFLNLSQFFNEMKKNEEESLLSSVKCRIRTVVLWSSLKFTMGIQLGEFPKNQFWAITELTGVTYRRIYGSINLKLVFGALLTTLKLSCIRQKLRPFFFSWPRLMQKKYGGRGV